MVFEIASIDRMYCNVFIPGLQYAAGLVGYVHQQLGLPIASTAPLAKISDRPVTRVPSPRADIDRGWSLTDTSGGARRGPSGFLN